VLHSASSGPYRHGERSHARALLDDLPERSLALLDRGYLQANVSRAPRRERARWADRANHYE
jgi:hypothetical protein